MGRKSKYGNMPERPECLAKVKGDAGLYTVWGVDWMNHKILIDRAGLEWTDIAKITFVDPEVDQDEADGHN